MYARPSRCQYKHDEIKASFHEMHEDQGYTDTNIWVLGDGMTPYKHLDTEKKCKEQPP